MPSSHLILCCPLFFLPPISPSIRVFSNESTLRMRWPKYWSFSFSIISSKEHPGLISFRMENSSESHKSKGSETSPTAGASRAESKPIACPELQKVQDARGAGAAPNEGAQTKYDSWLDSAVCRDDTTHSRALEMWRQTAS